MPRQATPLQPAQLLAALSVGSEIIRLRHNPRRLGLGADLGAALAAVAEGNSAIATARLARLDEVLAARAAGGPGTQTALQAGASQGMPNGDPERWYAQYHILHVEEDQ
jgi:hypothetical protein